PPPHPHPFPTRRSSDLQPHQLFERLLDLPPTLRGQAHRPDDGPLAAPCDPVPPTVSHAVTPSFHAGASWRAILSATLAGLPAASDRKSTRLNSSHRTIS